MTIRAETNDECNNGLQSCWTQCHALPEVARPPVMLEIENPSWLLGECRFSVAPGDYRVSTALSPRYGASNEIPVPGLL
jgi:hypothetical protein